MIDLPFEPRSEQLLAWPGSKQLCLPEQSALEHAAQVLEVPVPRVRWFRSHPAPHDGRFVWAHGFVNHGELVVWLSVSYRTPRGLAVTTAHEAVHYW